MKAIEKKIFINRFLFVFDFIKLNNKKERCLQINANELKDEAEQVRKRINEYAKSLHAGRQADNKIN